MAEVGVRTVGEGCQVYVGPTCVAGGLMRDASGSGIHEDCGGAAVTVSRPGSSVTRYRRRRTRKVRSEDRTLWGWQHPAHGSSPLVCLSFGGVLGSLDAVKSRKWLPG